jgi:hypothetical protein
MKQRRRWGLLAALPLMTLLAVNANDPTPAGAATTPIRHVVVIYQENHSFDNALGVLCVRDQRCDGATVGKLSNGSSYPLTTMPDIVPPTAHNTKAQATAIDGGKMDGWDRVANCKQAQHYQCMAQYDPDRGAGGAASPIRNLAALARRFAISDRTFEMDAIPSWGAHLELAAQDLDGFTGNNPVAGTDPSLRGTNGGCTSGEDAEWRASPTSPIRLVPSCVPDQQGLGPYKPSPVAYVPTIMDRLQGAGLSWKIYGKTTNIWGICPIFYECWGHPDQRQFMVDTGKILTDANNGTLPSLSLVMPTGPTGKTSQHNFSSMTAGDNWIGQMVSALMNGPQWNSTAIFITYDDCGCFYDHVPPPSGLGIRVPMVIVSPFAKAGFTDSRVASFSSMLSYVEHTFGLAPLTSRDAGAYDYAQSFDYTQAPLSPVPLSQQTVPATSQVYLRQHPMADDEDDT